VGRSHDIFVDVDLIVCLSVPPHMGDIPEILCSNGDAHFLYV
jgi:hypothetical protein